jgi:hypothetical protein
LSPRPTWGMKSGSRAVAAIKVLASPPNCTTSWRKGLCTCAVTGHLDLGRGESVARCTNSKKKDTQAVGCPGHRNDSVT